MDTFSGNLANGWRIYDVSKVGIVGGTSDARVQDPAIISGGPGPIKISVGWDTGRESIYYQFRVYAEGPAGTSWK